MDNEPKMSTWVMAALASAFFAIVAYYSPERLLWLRMLSLLVAIIFGVVFVVSALDWMVYRTSERIRDIEMSRVAGVVQLAHAMQGLNTNALDIVARHDVTKIVGLVGETEILWVVKCPDMDVPFDFVQEYLIWSQNTAPYLWPISQAHMVGVYSKEDKPWPNCERLATAFTDLLVKIEQLAEPAIGPQPAKLKVPLERVAKKYGVEV